MNDEVKVKVIGPLPDGAVLETTASWDNHYRVRKDNDVTEWGVYMSIFELNGTVYLSPYWTDSSEWIAATSTEAINFIAVRKKT